MQQAGQSMPHVAIALAHALHGMTTMFLGGRLQGSRVPWCGPMLRTDS